MLGVFAKIPRGTEVKTRLQTLLSRAEAERFYLACLADTLETATSVVERPFLFLDGGTADTLNSSDEAWMRTKLVATGLLESSWESLRLCTQQGTDLGERMERAFEVMFNEQGRGPLLLIGSDSPTLDRDQLVRGLDLLIAGPGLEKRTKTGQGSETNESAPEDVVLGPAVDGGYYAIGVRRPFPGLLRNVAWSSPRTLAETLQRADQMGLRVALLSPWTDVDRPEDLVQLAWQIASLRAAGNVHIGFHSEVALRDIGLIDSSCQWLDR